MRVISGSKRGAVLFSPVTEGTRPTTDRVKENIFNLIQSDVSEKKVLDLFSGSGAMGIEAISRGAKSCDFVDFSKEAVGIIKKNIDKTSLNEKAKVFLKSFDAFLNNVNEKYSLVFLDPPYHKGYVEDAIKIMIKRNLLYDGAVIVCECDYDEEIPDFPGLLSIKERLYGRVKITVLRKEPLNENSSIPGEL